MDGALPALPITESEYAEVYQLLVRPALEAHVAAPGKKRKKCKRTPRHPHCKSVKWSRVYEALRRKGKSKKNAAQIANHMHNKWMQGRVKRKTWP